MNAGGAIGLGAAFDIQRRVVGALILRELATRFGRGNLGYLWLFLEPALLGGTIGLVHHLAGHALPGGLPTFVFWVIGYIPYYLFRGVLNRAAHAIEANRTLLFHRRITLFDLVLARNLLEGAAALGAMAAFTLGFGAVLGHWPAAPVTMLAGMALMLALSHGVAMLIAAGSLYTEMFDRLIHIVTYLALPVSGAFFMVFWLPGDLQRAALWIPTVHCFELVREGQFGTRVPTHHDVAYVLAWAVSLNLLGLAALRRARRDLVV